MRLRAILFLVFLHLLAGCGAQRCSRFYAKHPECFTATSDTLVEYDTIISERVEFDTAFMSSGEIDTFYLEIDKVKTRIIRQVDTLLVTQTIEPDTVIESITLIKTTNTVADRKRRLDWWVFVLIGAVAGLGLCAAFRR